LICAFDSPKTAVRVVLDLCQAAVVNGSDGACFGNYS
jgi:hypothetical protein